MRSISLRCQRRDDPQTEPTAPGFPLVFPGDALNILEERIRRDAAEGIKLPGGVDATELAFRILVLNRVMQRDGLSSLGGQIRRGPRSRTCASGSRTRRAGG